MIKQASQRIFSVALCESYVGKPQRHEGTKIHEETFTHPYLSFVT